MARWVAVLALAAVTASGSFAQTPAKKLKLQLGAQVPYVGFIEYYIAEQAGFFKDEGLAVEINYSSGAPQAAQLVAANQADVASVVIEPLALGYDKGIRGKAILRLNNALIFYVAVPEDSPIKRVEDLKGQKIGVANLGSGAVPVVRSILRNAGVESTPDTLVPVGVFDQALAALRSGQVQALGLFDGIYFGLERAGHKFRYFRHPTLANFGNGALVASNAAVETKKSELCGISRAVAKAGLFLQENPEAALRMWWTVSPGARRGATDAEAVTNGLAELNPIAKTLDIGFPPKSKFGEFDLKAVSGYMDLLKQEGLIPQVPPVKEIATNEFVGCANQFDPEAVRRLAAAWKK